MRDYYGVIVVATVLAISPINLSSLTGCYGQGVIEMIQDAPINDLDHFCCAQVDHRVRPVIRAFLFSADKGRVRGQSHSEAGANNAGCQRL